MLMVCQPSGGGGVLCVFVLGGCAVLRVSFSPVFSAMEYQE